MNSVVRSIEQNLMLAALCRFGILTITIRLRKTKMPITDPRVDAYIEQAAPFAQPILRHLRAVVHDTCPEVEETMKWSFPHFMYQGMLCSTAAFKAHCALNFWKAELLMGDAAQRDAMGQFGRITALDDLPALPQLQAYLRQAMQLNQDGVAQPRVRTRVTTAVTVPDDLQAALALVPAAQQHFSDFTPGKQREYIAWLDEAKTEATRARRREQAVEWIAEGKARNWKYEKC
jgi:uncharacterized protein YdeI (YjbR/CyaY-like superfamily)